MYDVPLRPDLLVLLAAAANLVGRQSQDDEPHRPRELHVRALSPRPCSWRAAAATRPPSPMPLRYMYHREPLCRHRGVLVRWVFQLLHHRLTLRARA